jgi:hypothetical protein
MLRHEDKKIPNRYAREDIAEYLEKKKQRDHLKYGESSFEG